eukprot:g28730.t1
MYDLVPGFDADPFKDGALTVSKFLYNNGFSKVTEVDQVGWTPLHYAGCRGDPDLVRALLAQRANPNVKAAKDNVMAGALPKWRVMTSVAACRHHEVARILIEAKAELSGTQLVGACIGNDPEGIRLLCEVGGVSPHAADHEGGYGVLAINLACMYGATAALEELVAQAVRGSASGMRQGSIDVSHAFWLAACFGNCSAELVDTLLDLRADVNEQFHLSVRHPVGLLVKVMALKHRFGKQTHFSRMSFHAKGATPLMQAVMGGQYEAAAALIARGARLDLRNSHGYTVADLAKGRSPPVFLVQAFAGQLAGCLRVASLALGNHIRKQIEPKDSVTDPPWMAKRMMITQEFEVEDILRYRKNEDGSELFLVKWQGYPEDESTWEPLAHMNDNCRELIAKARALFAWRPNGDQSSSGEVVVSSSGHVPANSASPNSTAAEATTSSVAIIEEDKEDAQAAGGQPGLEEALGQEEEEEEEEDTEAEDVGAPVPAPAGDEEVSIIEDDEPPATSSGRSPALEPAKRPFDPSGFVGAPSDPRMKRPRLIPPTVEMPLGSGTWEAPVQPAKVPAPTTRPATNGVRHAPPSGPTSMPRSPASIGQAHEAHLPEPPKEPPKPPPSREIKCICGLTEQIVPNSRPGLIVCRVCNCSLHTNCVSGALHKAVPAHFVCPPCRLDRVDEFHPSVGAGVLKHSYASSTSTFSLTFAAQAAHWKKQCWAVHLRSVHIHGGDLSGPAWPHKVQGKMNGRQCVAIEPPKHLHVRREQCYNLTPLLKQGLNTLELRFFPKPDRAKDEPEDSWRKLNA